jgi:hypothetical protein
MRVCGTWVTFGRHSTVRATVLDRRLGAPCALDPLALIQEMAGHRPPLSQVEPTLGTDCGPEMGSPLTRPRRPSEAGGAPACEAWPQTRRAPAP